MVGDQLEDVESNKVQQHSPVILILYHNIRKLSQKFHNIGP